MKLTNKTYDSAKWVAQIGLPALATFYFAFAQIWSLPNGPEVVGSITAFDAFLGVILGLSSKAYKDSDAHYDGVMHVLERDGRKTFSLELDANPDDLETKSAITFKVNGT